MKNKKGFLIILILFLDFSYTLYSSNPLFNRQKDKEKTNFRIYLSASNSHVYEWTRTWGGISSDYGCGVAVDSSNNVYLVGYTGSFGAGYDDMVLVKYDNHGQQQWNCTWGGTYHEEARGVALDSLDNIYLAGYTGSFGVEATDIVLLKYDRYGQQQWNRTWGGANYEGARGVAVDSSDNIYLVGYTYSFGAGASDIVLVKYDTSGVLQWNCTWGGNNNEGARGVAVDSLYSIYIAGYTYSFGAGYSDLVLIKYDSFGKQQWNRTWGGTSYEGARGVAIDTFNNIYHSGYTTSYGAGASDMVLVKYNNSGQQQWNRTWGGIDYEEAGAVALDSLNNIYLAGYIGNVGAGYSNLILVKYDSSGVQKWNRTWGGTNYEENRLGVTIDSSDNIYLAGYTTSFGAGATDMVLVKYSELKEEKLGISGYPLLLFISVLGVITIICLKRKYNKLF